MKRTHHDGHLVVLAPLARPRRSGLAALVDVHLEQVLRRPLHLALAPARRRTKWLRGALATCILSRCCAARFIPRSHLRCDRAVRHALQRAEHMSRSIGCRNAPVQHRLPLVRELAVDRGLVEAAPRDARHEVALGERDLQPVCTHEALESRGQSIAQRRQVALRGLDLQLICTRRVRNAERSGPVCAGERCSAQQGTLPMSARAARPWAQLRAWRTSARGGTRCQSKQQRTSGLVVASCQVQPHVLAVIEQVVTAPGDPVATLRGQDVAAALRLKEQKGLAEDLVVRPVVTRRRDLRGLDLQRCDKRWPGPSARQQTVTWRCGHGPPCAEAKHP
jgi:hypothetical protein